MSNSVVFPRVQFFANNGRPLVGGRIHTYVAGSSTRARTYKDAAKAQPNANPIILDARGEASVYLADGVEYKFVIEDSTGALIMTQEPVYGAIWPNAAEWPSDATLSYQYMTDAKAAAGAIGPVKFFDTKAQADAAIGTLANGDILEISQDETRAGARTRYKVQGGALVFVVNLDQTKLDLAAATGAGVVGYLPDGVGAVATHVQDKLREFPSVEDQGATSGADTSAINAAIAQAISSGRPVKFNFNATVRIPTDAPTLQAAINAIEAAHGVTVTLNIEAGHVLTSGFRVTNRDCSFITITSTDATVTVSPSMALVSNSDLSSDVPRSSLIGFLAVRSKMPTWSILVDMAGLSCITGYELDYGSDGVVLPDKGVVNTSWAGGTGGVNCRVTTNSRLQAAQSVWTGAKAGNVTVSHNSFANLQNANVSTTANEACLDVSRGSIVHALGINVSNGAYAGIYARRSFVSAQGANVSNCGLGVWGGNSSFVGCPDSTFDGCTTDVTCGEGSFIGLGRSTKSGAALSPANSVVDGATSGTAAARAFNIAGGYGLIAYESHLPGNAEYLSANSGAVTITSATQQNIASLTYATALNLAGKRLVHGGAIYGPDVGLRITIDGNIVLNDAARVQGDDSTGGLFSMVQIPPCKCESSILIEAYNRSGAASDLAWRFYHTGAL